MERFYRGLICLRQTRDAGLPRAKVVVVRGGLYGLITLSDAKKRYGISEEEFNSWVSAVAEHGVDALKVTAYKKISTT